MQQGDQLVLQVPAHPAADVLGLVSLSFAIAKNNDTVDLIVTKAVKAVGGRVALIPWVMFAVTGVLTAIGAASPAAVAIMAPVALGFAAKYKISPLLMGMLVVHGAQAGGFSPISIYCTITNSVVAENNLPAGELTIFFASLFFNLLLAMVLFVLLGGSKLMKLRVNPDEEEITAELHTGGATVPVRGYGSEAPTGT